MHIVFNMIFHIIFHIILLYLDMTKIKIDYWALGVAALAACSRFSQRSPGLSVDGGSLAMALDSLSLHIPEMWISQWLDGLLHGKSEHQMDENWGNIPSSKGIENHHGNG